jgi:hypothetical protein
MGAAPASYSVAPGPQYIRARTDRAVRRGIHLLWRHVGVVPTGCFSRAAASNERATLRSIRRGAPMMMLWLDVEMHQTFGVQMVQCRTHLDHQRDQLAQRQRPMATQQGRQRRTLQVFEHDVRTWTIEHRPEPTMTGWRICCSICASARRPRSARRSSRPSARSTLTTTVVNRCASLAR